MASTSSNGNGNGNGGLKEEQARIQAPFSRVRSLLVVIDPVTGFSLAEDAAEKLTAACDALRTVGAHEAAERLLSIDKSVTQVDFPVLEGLAAPERAIDEIEQDQQKRVRFGHTCRNVLALIPLLLTWYGLAMATIYYNRELGKDPRLIAKPFLLLWEQGFHRWWSPPFSETALVDFGLLIGVVLLTLNIHHRERVAAATRTRISGQLDSALNTLAAALDETRARVPANAEEWAGAAERIIQRAMDQARLLSETTRASVEESTEKLAAIQAEGRTFINALGQAVRETITATQRENKQFIDRTTAEATRLLQQAATANRDLIKKEMTPLIGELRTVMTGLEEHHETYRLGVEKLSGQVELLGNATSALKDSAKTYTATAESIDAHLKVIEESQGAFITQSAETVRSMTESAGSMRQITDTLQTRLQTALEEITRNVAAASGQLAVVEQNLARTSTSMQRSSTALDRTTRALANLTSRARPEPWYRRLFG